MSASTGAASPRTWRKKPVEVEAVRWTGGNGAAMCDFAGPDFAELEPEDREDDATAEVWDKLHSTWIRVYTGQWIIRGVRGEFYPCADDVFEQTYEPAGAVP